MSTSQTTCRLSHVQGGAAGVIASALRAEGGNPLNEKKKICIGGGKAGACALLLLTPRAAVGGSNSPSLSLAFLEAGFLVALRACERLTAAEGALHIEGTSPDAFTPAVDGRFLKHERNFFNPPAFCWGRPDIGQYYFCCYCYCNCGGSADLYSSKGWQRNYCRRYLLFSCRAMMIMARRSGKQKASLPKALWPRENCKKPVFH